MSAHNVRFDLRVEMAPVDIPGLVFELHQDSMLAPQLVVSNHSGKVLQVLDDSGRAFLRIGPTQAEADVANEQFHRSRISGGGTPPEGSLSAKPRWRTVSREPNYGWFDPRIATGPVEIPYAVRAIGGQMPFGEWKIPLTLGGEKKTLQGFFVYTPPSKGRVRSQLLSPGDIAAGISVQLAPGQTPAIMLRNSSKQIVSVLDSRKKAFIRIGPDGTYANLSSPDWAAANAGGPVQGKGWQRISKSRSHVWLEARARYDGPLLNAPPKKPFPIWSVPLLIGDQPLELRGTHQWITSPAKTASN